MRETMDNFLNSLLSVSWSDMNESSDRSWVGSISSQPSSLLAGPVETFQVDEKSSIMPMVSSGHIMGNETTEDLAIAHENSSSIFSDGNLKYDIDKRLFLSGNLSQTNHNSQPSCGIETSEGGFSIPDKVTCNSSGILYDLELNSSLPHSALTISSSLESNGSEPPTIAQSIGEAHSVSSVPTIWPSLYSGISSLCGQEKAENLVFQGTTKCTDLLRKNQNELGSNLVTFVSGQQMKMAGANSPPQNQGTAEVNNNQLPSFSGGSQMLFYKTAEMHTNLQSEEITLKHQLGFSSNCPEQITQTNSSNCNVVSKPRMRARRGQATDPHSIAERLRREKIAERMKNLQELVPNSNKTDKASMLDEIIDYVKFLQLQVKVLSMSRLGAAGAVVPLITEGQAEATGSLHLSPMSHEGEDAFFDSHGDNLGFEQEVVKLMESSVTTAMQYLQSKGLCLMPIALAAAISNQKCSAAATPPLDTRKKDSSAQNNYADGVVNGLSSASVKQEEVSKSLG